MKNAGMSSVQPGPDTEGDSPKTQDFTSSDSQPNVDCTPAKSRDSLAELESALDDQLQNALSELSDLVGISFDTTPNGNDCSFPCSATSDAVSSSTLSNVSQVPKTDNLSVHIPRFKRDLPQKGHTSIHTSQNGANRQDFQDYSPDGAEVDSAFSDSSSLPSSGSHVSVTTTSSQNSNGSASSCNSGSSGIGNSSHMAVVSLSLSDGPCPVYVFSFMCQTLALKCRCFKKNVCLSFLVFI